ncbi:MAG TPA: hypothetical protein VFX92_05670 [Candidatus Krumholzibacteria bacterium]|nr:hypothetical protein [Candidatus Krumholzibacteria bacterium]
MKNQRRFGSLLPLGAVTAVIMLAAGVAWSQESEPTTTRAAMRGVFVVLSQVYGYSMDPKVFDNPDNRAAIMSKLEALAKNADQLESHGGGLDPSFDVMRRSLSRDAHQALDDFKTKNYIGSRFVLGRITDNCVTCHTKLPSERQFELGEAFLDEIDAAKLPPAARANLQVAARQFPDAMQTYEEVLKSPTMTADDLAMFDVFENYLRISTGAMNDTARPVRALQEFATRTDIPDALKADVRGWIADLQTLHLDVPVAQELTAARHLVTDAMQKTKSHADRSQLVHFIGSITLVHRYLRAGSHSDAETAEAYYLLGVSESYVSHSYWVSESDYLLDKSIRTAPKSPVAKQALAFLEQLHAPGNTAVIPAREVPKEWQVNMEELRNLVGN